MMIILVTDTLKVLELLKPEDHQQDSTNFLFLIIGWMLGLFGTIIIESLKKRSRKNEVKKAIITEIKSIRSILVANAASLSMKYGTYNKAIIKLIDENINDFSNQDGFEKFKEIIAKFRNLDEAELTQQSASYKELRKSDSSHLKTVKCSYLNANMNLVSLFDLKFQNFLIRFSTSLNQLNEDVLQSRFYYEKTFDISMGEENHNIIKANLLGVYRTISNKSVEIVELINKHISK